MTTASIDLHHDQRGAGANAFVIDVSLRGQDGHDRDRLEEALGLTAALGLAIVGHASVTLSRPVPASLIGKGRVESLGHEIAASGADLVVVDTALTPVQQRNLERAWRTKVIDRTGLILEIFADRAKTREGRLQVELAHLQYQRTRLVRSWTHLERQRGGAGFMGGPGETQLEADRRAIAERITRLQRQLDKVRRTRGLHRRARTRVPHPVVALVGYTNAGKSTLFNQLTRAQVVARDQLFATLDPTMRAVVLPHGRKVIVSDTVGFISDLPTTLVAAFRATLEEVVSADVIVHVRDISHRESRHQAADVDRVLGELGIGEKRRGDIIEAWNKVDLVSRQERRRLTARARRRGNAVLVSARTGEGVDRLVSLIEEHITAGARVWRITLAPDCGSDIGWLYRHGEVLARNDGEDGSMTIDVRLDEANLARARKRFSAMVPAPGKAALKAAE